MTAKEALKLLKIKAGTHDDEHCFPNMDCEKELNGKTDEAYELLVKALTELEELKCDVKSVYAELAMYIGNNIMIEQEELDIDYLCNVIEKLSKVGVKE